MTQAKPAAFWMTFPVLLLACLAAATHPLPGTPSNNLNTGFSADKSGSPNRSKRMTDFAQPGHDDTADKLPSFPVFSGISDVEPESEKYLDGEDDVDRNPGYVFENGKSFEGFIHDDPSYADLDSASPENNKRASQFLRIGRGRSGFVRIGKSEGDDSENVDKRASSFVRIGRAPSSFVRIGKAPSSFVRIGRAPSSFVRIGRAPSSFVRIGKAPSSFVRIGRAPSSFVRIGKSPSNFVRIGKSDDSFDEKDAASTDYTEEIDNSEKRASSFVRIGKAPSSFVRIGKAPSSFVRIGKAPSSFVRIGKADQAADVNENLGSESSEKDKRPSGFVRIGKSGFDDEINDAKRASSFVRIGKSELSSAETSELQKRASSFVRIGKSVPSDSQHSELLSPPDASSKSAGSFLGGNSVDNENPIKVETRGSAFVRIGKIPSSAFVRIGKNAGLLIDEAENSRNIRGSQSTFVRIGK
ncbi:hypothetical protein BsWGS_18871 [Bradybaena similaris]